jgi:hypothetical protein
MSDQETRDEIDKLKYHISVLTETIDYNSHPVELLILSMDWGRKELNAAHDIFEKWDKILRNKGEIDQSNFESDFEDRLGLSYQRVKSVVLAFWKNDQWTDVCEALVDSMGEYPSVEYLVIKNRQK